MSKFSNNNESFVLNYIVVIYFCCLSIAYSENLDFGKACSPSSAQILTAEEGDIYSPGFKENKPYPANSDCTFVMHLVNKKNIIIEVKFMDLEENSDCVEVYAPELSRQYCGSNITERLFIFARDAESVSIKFRSESKTSRKGFLLHYKYTYETSLCGAKQLQCRNSHCVPLSVICNLKDDCGDGSDEQDCKKKLTQDVECGYSLEEPDLKISSRIVGGQEAVPGSWPWQADQQFTYVLPNAHACGGSLINSQWVVTAFHCLKGHIEWRIHLGNHNKYKKDKYEKIRYIKSAHSILNENHTGINQALLDNDIALIRLNAEVEYNNHIRPVCLPQQDFEIKAGTICYTSGWGETRGSGASSALKQVPVKILESCNIPADAEITFNQRTMICGSVYKNSGGVCFGDSGGPLVCQVNGRWHLIGISSFVFGRTNMDFMCGVENFDFVFQKVSPHVRWIEDIIKTEV